MAQNEGFVGLDVGKFEIFAFISKTGMTFLVPNTSSGHRKLRSKLGPARGQIIALEPTGGYEWAVWEALDVAGYDVRQVSAAHVRAFSRASGALAKTDPIDACLIADFIAFRPTSGRKFPAKKLRYLNALSTKRRQLVDLRKHLKCQTTQHSDSAMVTLDVSVRPDRSYRSFQGSSSSIRLILWSAMHARVSASQACGSTPFSLAVSIRV